MILLRGDSVISVTVEAPPAPNIKKPGESLIGKAVAGRGGQSVVIAPPGLVAPSQIVGGRGI